MYRNREFHALVEAAAAAREAGSAAAAVLWV
jgi:hypothetical protein